MNDAARDLLIKAALTGRKQVVGKLHENIGPGEIGSCALGVLHESMHEDVLEALRCVTARCRWFTSIDMPFDLTEAEIKDIIDRNDNRGEDFLTIARKVGQE